MSDLKAAKSELLLAARSYADIARRFDGGDMEVYEALKTTEARLIDAARQFSRHAPPVLLLPKDE